MKKPPNLLAHLARPEVSELVLATGLLPRVRRANALEAVGADPSSSEEIVEVLFAVGGSRYAEELGPRAKEWRFRIDGVGLVSVRALQRGDELEVRIAVQARREATASPRSDAAPTRRPKGKPSAPPKSASSPPTTARPLARAKSLPPARTRGLSPPVKARTLPPRDDAQARSTHRPGRGAAESPAQAQRQAETEARSASRRSGESESASRPSGDVAESLRTIEARLAEAASVDDHGTARPSSRTSRTGMTMPSLAAARPPRIVEVDPDADEAGDTVSGGALASQAASQLALLRRLAIGARQAGASDLHLAPGRAPRIRVAGALSAAGEPLSAEILGNLVFELLPDAAADRLTADGACTFGASLSGAGNVRIHVSRQDGGLGLRIHLAPNEVATLDALGLPQTLATAVRGAEGLILVTGPAGAGKTTTLAALVGALARGEPPRHVVTVEDPIELPHPGGAVSQREIGTSVASMAAALDGALRIGADVFVIGETCDAQGARTALAACAAGLTVVSTLAARNAFEGIARLLRLAGRDERAAVARHLTAVFGQRLVPRTDHRRSVVACEVVGRNEALAACIRDGGSPAELAREGRLGDAHALTLDASVADLVRRGRVSADDARHAVDGGAAPRVAPRTERATTAADVPAARRGPRRLPADEET